jgi:hypothetical protein
MNLPLRIDIRKINEFGKKLDRLFGWSQIIGFIALVFAVCATSYYLQNDLIVAYGDAESHLNIAKRVVDSITPGFAQLGGIWLPVPHILMIPFVSVDFLWRTGLAGSIVSGFSFIVSSIFLFRLLRTTTRSTLAAVFGAMVFITNPNILYLQSTPMTELPLLMFFMLSTYYFVLFLQNDKRLLPLIAAAFFGFLATLSRYDGWFLVLVEAGVLVLFYAPKVLRDWRKYWPILQGKFITFATPAFFGILIWFVWDYLILGDPFYFTNSQFSAKTQQDNWYLRGELPAYHNVGLSILYYMVTAMSNVGVLLFVFSMAGCYVYVRDKSQKSRYLIALVMAVPFIFYIVTLWLGQSVIFIPHITPATFEWRLFNVRYGIMALPFAAFFAGYLFKMTKPAGRGVLLMMMGFQMAMFIVGYSPTITLEDGTVGLSHAKRPDAERWLKKNYDGGIVFMDDYARTISIVRSGIPMNQTIYVGNHPYWEDSLRFPERYSTWIVMQKNDTIWSSLYSNPQTRDYLFTHFTKTYTSPDILIFKRTRPLTEDPKVIKEQFHPKVGLFN